MSIVNETGAIGINIYPGYRELCVTGLTFVDKCPQCRSAALIDSGDYMLTREEIMSNEKIPCCPTFQCPKCKHHWEQEFWLKIKVEAVQCKPK